MTSPKLRALQTAELIAPAIGARYESDHRLAGPLDIALLERIAADAGGSSVMLVGHDPDFSDLCAELIGASSLPLKKGALARLDGPRPLRAGGATLRWLVPPDLLTSD